MMSSEEDADAPFDARRIDPYGETFRVEANGVINRAVNPVFVGDGPIWTANIDDIDGASLFQLRFSFINNIETGLSPELTSLGFSFGQF